MFEDESYMKTYRIPCSNCVSLICAQGNESHLFRKMASKYRVANPLEVFYDNATRSASSTTQAHGKQEQLKREEYSLTLLPIDDMVFLALRLIVQQDNFQKTGKYPRVDIGYHYTKRQYLERIKSDGLLNKQERISRKISSTHNGSRYGEGIYTTSDAQSSSYYGSIGLMVVRLKGESLDKDEANRGFAKGNNSITTKDQPSLLVLQHRSQCLPIISFSAEIYSTNQRYLARLKCFERHVQCILEKYFHATTNNSDFQSKRRVTDRFKKSIQRPRRYASPRVIDYKAPENLDEANPIIDVPFWQHQTNDECSICLCPLRHFGTKMVRLANCGHLLHKDCALKMLAKSSL